MPKSAKPKHRKKSKPKSVVASKPLVRGWYAAGLVLAVLVVGILVVRLSRADSDVPLNEAELRSYIQKQIDEDKTPGSSGDSQPSGNNTTTGTSGGGEVLSGLGGGNSANAVELQATLPSSIEKQLSTNQAGANSSKQVAGVIELKYSPTKVSGYDRVGYYLDGQLHTVSSSGSNQISFDTTRIENGEHTVVAVSLDKNNKISSSVSKTFEVQNNLSIWQKIRNFLTAPFYALIK